MQEEIFEEVEKIRADFMNLVAQKHPELEVLYKHRFEYALGPYPKIMRLHNAYEILRTYALLRGEK